MNLKNITRGYPLSDFRMGHYKFQNPYRNTSEKQSLPGY